MHPAIVGSILFVALSVAIPALHKAFSAHLNECEEMTVAKLAGIRDTGEYDIFIEAAQAYYGNSYPTDRVTNDYKAWSWYEKDEPFYVRHYLRGQK